MNEYNTVLEVEKALPAGMGSGEGALPLPRKCLDYLMSKWRIFVYSLLEVF